ncbi:hypothetical protein P280DRAFT_552691 [Massarina eburnea CBS 473.64]|uniref:DUF7730 domain-containing protein n=1 Tax=Massarina eburnea CBS 473.64 TaxID=1395130 RepID=A0A6A6RNL0_9PLEO|nr:hypothetical protein P280DRAFT_552691 [Massarina eburnea CBS 473.64]
MSPAAKERVVKSAQITPIGLLSPLVTTVIAYYKNIRLWKRQFGHKMDDVYRRRAKQYERRNSLSNFHATETRLTKLQRLIFRKNRARTDSQEHCMLFSKLPVEIRTMIWKYVLCEREITQITHGYKKKNATLHFEDCFSGDECSTKGRGPALIEESAVLGHIACVEDHDYERDTKRAAREKYPLLPLVMACRRVYAETLPILYTENAFIMTLDHTFLTFALSIPPSHFNLIHSLILYLPGVPDLNKGWNHGCWAHSWSPTLEVVTKMAGLQQCHFIVRDDWEGDEVKDLLKALKKMEVQKDLETKREEEGRRTEFVVDWVGHVHRGAEETGLKFVERFIVSEVGEDDLVGEWGADGCGYCG